MPQYYDGTKLLSMTDINGKKPELYLCTSNRTGGKTTYFGRYFVNRYLKFSEKFGLLYRFNYELDDISEKFFKDIGSLFFPEHTLTSKRRAKGVFHELFMDVPEDENPDAHPECSCGYALALNNADVIKKYSHLFSDIVRMLMDEFQSETNHYCADEVKKLISIHTSVARGQGKQVRYVPVFMLSNPVSLINPYYVELGISSRLQKDTKFLRGNGFVLEQGYNEGASKAQLESAFNRAFASNDYVAYSSEAVYLNDSIAFLDKPEGKSRYILTLKYKAKEFGIREYTESGYIYCDNHPDKNFNTRITVTTEDHNINYVMLKRNDLLLSNLRYLFERGAFRFKDLQCKEAVLQALSY